MMPRIVFAHGLEGSPNGTKARALREAGFDVVAPDFSGEVLRGRVLRLRAAIDDTLRGHDAKLLLAASSYGGLCAAYVAAQAPKAIGGLLLFAPALGHREDGPDGEEIIGERLAPPKGMRTVVIHGRNDAVCALSHSLTYVAKSKHARLVEVDDGHRLAESLAVVVDEARKLLETFSIGTPKER